MTSKWVILDRDGVINQDSEHYIKSPDEWQPIAGSLEAIAKLNRAGYQIAVATNQSGINRGLYTVETLDKIHQKMLTLLSEVNGHIIDIAYCPHHPDEGCPCRKPEPGMLVSLAKTHQIDLSNAVMVGDSLKDLQAAAAVNCSPVLVRTGNGQLSEQQMDSTLSPLVKIFDDLDAVATALLQGNL